MKTLKKFALIMLVMVLLPFSAGAQSNQEVMDWMLSRCWSKGFKALPESCTNLNEFYDQYHKNQAQWDAMFQWLATHDLTAIPAGRHKIEGSTLVASVEDSQNIPIEAHKGAESHFHHIDFQFVVKGCEGFGLPDHATTYPSKAYVDDFQAYSFDKDKVRYIDSTPNRFFLFFPNDWHIAKIATEQESQDIRVIVIKLDYVK